MNKLKYIAAVVTALAGFGLQQAKADFVSTLNVGNSAISGFPSPYGTVNVSLSGDTATITFTAASVYSFGGAQAIDVNVNGGFTTGTITDNGAGTFSFASNTTNAVDGFGHFNLQIDASDGFPSSATVVQFTITANSPGQWSSASQVLAFNDHTQSPGPFDAAAHIFVPQPGGTAATGFAAENAGGVPDGGTTVMLLGAALSALGMARRFLKC
jgi:protein with PEP-CTERM/exosortase system signal